MEDLQINTAQGKQGTYETLLQQLDALVEPGISPVANLSNMVAALKQTFNWWWVGFYFVAGEELILGPFQGPMACTRIAYGKGVCGSTWKQAKTLVVPDVEQFPGHIACSAASKSEIVVPVLLEGQVIAVLDVDSEWLNHFDDTDAHYLEQLCQRISGEAGAYRLRMI